MDHGSARLTRIALVASLAFACGVSSPPYAGTPAADAPGTPFDAPLAGPPLAPPLQVTGGFCEYRIGHFHAGFDFGTGQRVGKPVLAPARGHVARVRASGVGYGRSIYVATDDGRLLQFGHLDAYAEPLASYVRAVQDSSGQYEQDLWPEANRFRFETGAVIAWSGESGAGGPHLHFEIRRGDMAYHPYRAGLAVRDSAAPTLASLTLEPLDGASFVEGSAAPVTRRLGARPETLRVIGRLRTVVGARDGEWRGVDRMVPWSVGMEWEGRRVEARFDSVSWATDMAEGDAVYDAGRVVGDKGLLLWAPAGFRPRVMVSDVPIEQEAGTILVRPGDPPRTLRLWARDLGGNRTERKVTLTPGRERPDTTGALPKLVVAPGSAMELASLPGGWLRVQVRDVPAWSRGVRIVAGNVADIVPVSTGPGGATAVIRMTAPAAPGPWLTVIGSQGKTGKDHAWMRASSFQAAAISPTDSVTIEAQSYRVRVPAGTVFEPAVLLARGDEATPASGELRSGGASLRVEPAGLPLRRALRVALACPPTGMPRNVAFYRRSDNEWDWIGGSFDAGRGEFVAETRRLGQFSLMVDSVAPRVVLQRAPKKGAVRPYSRWALQATVSEAGAGLDPRASHFMIDGRRVATEWDSEARVLRWRPAKPPRSGKHQVTVVATDRAGNTRRTAGSFVLD